MLPTMKTINEPQPRPSEPTFGYSCHVVGTNLRLTLVGSTAERAPMALHALYAATVALLIQSGWYRFGVAEVLEDAVVVRCDAGDIRDHIRRALGDRHLATRARAVLQAMRGDA